MIAVRRGFRPHLSDGCQIWVEVIRGFHKRGSDRIVDSRKREVTNEKSGRLTTSPHPASVKGGA